jgi:hypothetical protein
MRGTVLAGRALIPDPTSARLPRNRQSPCVKARRLPAKTAAFIELPREDRAAAVETMVSKTSPGATTVDGIFAAFLRRHVPAETMGLRGHAPLLDRWATETIVPKRPVATAQAGNSAARPPRAGAGDRAAIAAEAAANTVAAVEKAGAIDPGDNSYKSIFPRPGTVLLLSGLFFYVRSPSVHFAFGANRASVQIFAHQSMSRNYLIGQTIQVEGDVVQFS